MISSHLNEAHNFNYNAKKFDYTREIPQNQPADINNSTTIKNLQTLQDKIRSTIKPYLNM